MEPFIGSLYRIVRDVSRQTFSEFSTIPVVLDVGGRTSSYTIGMNAIITVSDIPQQTSVQKELGLGFTPARMEWLQRNRSNVLSPVLDDMTHSSFESESFDCILAIEVLEHVNNDLRFIQEVHRVLKNKGVFIMTTPNGETVPNTNPDHVRHYSKKKLMELLSSEFSSVAIEYIVNAGGTHKLGRSNWSIKKPIHTFISMMCRLINSLLSGKNTSAQMAMHPLAVAKK